MQTSETVCFTSYRTPFNGDLLNSVTIWQACRATSTAPSFFDPIAVGKYGEEFVGGAAGVNDPVRELWAAGAESVLMAPYALFCTYNYTN